MPTGLVPQGIVILRSCGLRILVFFFESKDHRELALQGPGFSNPGASGVFVLDVI